jgi:hypothetical protein
LNFEYWFIAFLPLWLLILMFCNSLPVGGLSTSMLATCLVSTSRHLDKFWSVTSFTRIKLSLLVVWVKIAKAEPQFSDLIYELQHSHSWTWSYQNSKCKLSCPVKTVFGGGSPRFVSFDLNPVREL